jgi:hypothetical protein
VVWYRDPRTGRLVVLPVRPATWRDLAPHPWREVAEGTWRDAATVIPDPAATVALVAARDDASNARARILAGLELVAARYGGRLPQASAAEALQRELGCAHSRFYALFALAGSSWSLTKRTWRSGQPLPLCRPPERSGRPVGRLPGGPGGLAAPGG